MESHTDQIIKRELEPYLCSFQLEHTNIYI